MSDHRTLLHAIAPRRVGLALLCASGLALAACSGEAPNDAGTPTAGAEAETAVLEPSSQSVPDLLENADGMQTVAEALKQTGLAGIFKGNGSYTLLAPDDATFRALGDSGKALTGGNDNAALAALLKEHMIPGYVSLQDIGNAIDQSKDGSVTMPSLGGDALTFARSGGTITVTSPDGATATIDGDPLAGSESIAIPVSGLLREVAS